MPGARQFLEHEGWEAVCVERSMCNAPCLGHSGVPGSHRRRPPLAGFEGERRSRAACCDKIGGRRVGQVVVALRDDDTIRRGRADTDERTSIFSPSTSASRRR